MIPFDRKLLLYAQKERGTFTVWKIGKTGHPTPYVLIMPALASGSGCALRTLTMGQ